jgi:divalent metal cation (Fe/Co/Zn/Cd) transporter
VALREFRAAKGDASYFRAFRESKDPPAFMVLFEDSAALIGLLLAALGTYAAERFNEPVFDGLASIGIGLVLATVSVVLARETKGLLMGERADSALSRDICRLAGAQRGVHAVNGLITVQLGPRQIVVNLSIDFVDALRAAEVESAIEAIETTVRAAHPDIVAVFVKPQTGARFREAVRARGRQV